MVNLLPLKKDVETENDLPKIYSVFKYPYTKIEFIEKDLGVSSRTATRYLESLVKKELLQKQKIGRNNFYLNKSLFKLLSGI